MTAPGGEGLQACAVLARAERAAWRLQEQTDGQGAAAVLVDLDDVRLVIDANRVLRRATDPTPPTIELGERAR